VILVRVGILDGLEEAFDAGSGDFPDRLDDRGQMRKDLQADGGIIEAYDRQVIRYVDAQLVRGEDGTHRHFVIARKNRGWRFGLREEHVRRAVAALDAVVPFRHQGGWGWQTVFAQCVKVSGEALPAESLGLQAGDMGDAPVSQADQVASRLTCSEIFGNLNGARVVLEAIRADDNVRNLDST